MRNKIIRVDGTEEEIVGRLDIKDIEKRINANVLDTVNLRDGRVMIVDDLGHPGGKPVNPAATKLYHAVCRPGTTHTIVGDVAVVWDNDWD